MKYIKTYERIKKELQKGDFIGFFDNENKFHIGEILEIEKDSFGDVYDVLDENDVVRIVFDNKFKRKLKPEEIEDFKILKKSKKYNL